MHNYFDVLLEYGYAAKLAVENGVATEAVEKIVEANTLLSGLGFESAGLAASHAVHNGLTVLEETHDSYHGEKVAFGVLTQLVLENRAPEEIDELLCFLVSVGLPVTLEDIGITEPTKEKLMKVAQATCAPGETIHNHAMPITVDAVYAAIVAADALGRDFKFSL
jgi:glycerol dehydrogenase